MSLRPIPVLLYHRIEPAGAETSSATSTPLDLFTAHMEWLAENGFRSLTMEELTARVNGAPPSAEREVAITFDDGYTCLDWAAAPVLRSTGFNATAFLITSRVDDERFITWDQARSLSDEGVMEFYSHTHNHKRWDLGRETFDTIVAEIRKSRELLSANLRRPVEEFNYMAWPYGRTCQPWDEAALEAGVTTQFVVQRGAITHRGRHSRLPRLMADGMSLPLFSRLVNTLSTRPGAAAFNLVFGSIRGLRRKGAYI